MADGSVAGPLPTGPPPELPAAEPLSGGGGEDTVFYVAALVVAVGALVALAAAYVCLCWRDRQRILRMRRAVRAAAEAEDEEARGGAGGRHAGGKSEGLNVELVARLAKELEELTAAVVVCRASLDDSSRTNSASSCSTARTTEGTEDKKKDEQQAEDEQQVEEAFTPTVANASLARLALASPLAPPPPPTAAERLESFAASLKTRLSELAAQSGPGPPREEPAGNEQHTADSRV